MYIDQRKEQFSIAYVHAVASAAGFGLLDPRVDDDSIDLRISANRKYHVSAPELSLQLKCYDGADRSKGTFSYFLKKKNYDELCGEPTIARLLLVVCVPKDVTKWLDQQPDWLAMYHCGYWHSLRKEKETANATGETVHINTKNAFTVAELTRLMAMIAKREYP
ncbi:MAG TPA: DUF4365 domain-containing protein [Myxococcaceae bacterium]|jgi:hypothetical protein